jgi:hypothetical protein
MPTQSSKNAVIDASEVTKTPRGRKAEINQDLLDFLGNVEVGQAASLEGTYGLVTDKTERQSVSAKIRRHATRAWGEGNCSINYSPTGVPQVTRKG